jgi:spore coat protein CotF
MIYYTYIFHYFYNIYLYQQQLDVFYGFCMKEFIEILREGDLTFLIYSSSYLVSTG